MILGLKRARALIEQNGWVGHEREPMCARGDGSWCLQDDEGLTRYSVGGALMHVFGEAGFIDAWLVLEGARAETRAQAAWSKFVRWAGDPTAWTQATYAEGNRLERAARDTKDLERWLQEPTRTTKDVLQLFVDAIGAAKKAQRAA